MLSVADARLLVNLLKLAVSGRAGEQGQETLAAVLMAMGKANQEVRQEWVLKSYDSHMTLLLFLTGG